MSVPRKTILYIHHGSGMGGAPQLLLKLLKKLDRNLYEPVVWCIRRSSASRLFEENGFKVIIDEQVIPFLHISDGFYGIRHPHLVLKMLFGQVRSYRTARRVISEIKPDIIHLNTSVLPGVLYAASRYPCPVVVNVLECLHHGYTGFRRWLIHTCSRKWGDLFVFMLPSEAERWGLLNTPGTVIAFDFIETDLFRNEPVTSELRDECGISQDIPLIGYFGRFTPAKGTDLLLRALAVLKTGNIPFHAVLIGPKETEIQRRGFMRRQSLADIIAKEHLENEVTFTGEHVQVEKLVPQCDILAVPFIEPHFSRLCGEAAASGRPAVAFAIDGPGEEIVDRRTGLLAEPGNIDDLADKLAYLCSNPAERERMGTAAMKRAETLFNGNRNAEKVFSLYRQCINK
jgi:glycosyltransferase involved in cell wall biosynthesis